MSGSGTDRRVVVVTGGARGIGAAIAARFADLGDAVAVGDLGEPEQPDPRVRYATLDVTSESSVEEFFAGVTADLGPVDVLVNNAGIWFRKPFREISVEEWDRVMGVNLRGAFLCIRAVVGPMEEAGRGVIVNLGSQAGLSVTRGQGAHYHATKAAIIHLTKVLGFELGGAGIRVNCVAPGATSPPGQPISPVVAAQVPLGRPGTPEEVASAVVFLASEDASFVTGQTLLVNGGAVALL